MKPVLWIREPVMNDKKMERAEGKSMNTKECSVLNKKVKRKSETLTR